ncbi:MAG: DoxX family protein [Thioalkalivibrionaceae bacterium]
MDDVGKLLLRVSLGVLILMHGVHKVFNGIAGIEGLVVQAGLPAWFAYGVYVGEVLAPVLVISGLYSRIGAMLIAVTMVFAVGLAHANEVFALTRTGGWAIELQWMFFIAAVAVALSGPGRYAINSR